MEKVIGKTLTDFLNEQKDVSFSVRKSIGVELAQVNTPPNTPYKHLQKHTLEQHTYRDVFIFLVSMLAQD